MPDIVPYPGYLPAAGTYFSLNGRVCLVKQIQSRDGVSSVNIPVTVQVVVKITGDRNWDKVFAFDLVDDQDVSRSTHVAKVYSTGNLDFLGDNSGADPSQSIDVERVDQFVVYDGINQAFDAAGRGQIRILKRPWGGRGWDSVYALDTVTGEGDQNTPANFGMPNSAGKRAHVARWFKTDDLGNVTDATSFVDVQYIDQLAIIDTYAGQSWRFVWDLSPNNWVNPSFTDLIPDPINPQPFSQLG